MRTSEPDDPIVSVAAWVTEAELIIVVITKVINNNNFFKMNSPFLSNRVTNDSNAASIPADNTKIKYKLSAWEPINVFFMVDPTFWYKKTRAFNKLLFH